MKFDGYNCSVSDKKMIGIITKLKELSSRKSLKENFPDEELGLLQVLAKIRNAVEGWIAAYSFLDIEHQITELDKYVNITLYNIFEEFGFLLRKGSMEKIRTKKKIKFHLNGSIIWDQNSNFKAGLNLEQRKSTGIPLCMTTYRKSKAPMSFAERITATINNHIK